MRTGKLLLWVTVLCLLMSCAAKKEALRPSPLPRLEDVQVRLTANREVVGVRFRLVGIDHIDIDAGEIYLQEESSGEKFPVVRLQRIGRLAQFKVRGEKDIHYVMFRNRDGKLKLGSRVTMVVGPMRQEHLPVQM